MNEVIPSADRIKIQEMIINTNQIIRRHIWGNQTPKYQKLVLDWHYTAIGIHHSGNRGMKNPVEIEAFHINEHQWDDVGYH